MKPLKNSDGDLKPIQTLYLDTTFFDPVYSYLPHRDESMKELIARCRSWIQKGDDYIVDLRTPGIWDFFYFLNQLNFVFLPLKNGKLYSYKYCWSHISFNFCLTLVLFDCLFYLATIGVEYVLIALSKEFGQPIHVCDKAYEKYYRIPELSSAVTKSPNTKLHACLVCYAMQHMINVN